MKKIFVIIPDKTPSSFCAKSFAKGFKHTGFYVEKSFSSELEDNEIPDFKPDLVLCFDFCELSDGLLDKVMINNPDCIFIFDILTSINPKNRKKDVSLLNNFKGKKLILTADKSNLSIFNDSVYLPCGVNIKKYKMPYERYNHGISIFSNPDDINNLKIITDLISHFGKISLFSDEFDYLHSLENELWDEIDNPEIKDNYRKSYCGDILTEKDRAKAMSTSFVNVVFSSQTPQGVDYTVFEVMASSGFAICEETSEVKRLFDVGREIETFRYSKELIDKIEFYLQHPSFARSIADNARMAAVNNHAVQIRVRKICTILKNRFK